MRIALLALITVLLASACTDDSGRSRFSLDPAPFSPDEFMIQTANPLAQPASFTDLPPPAPGGRNLASIDPDTLAAAAFGRSSSRTAISAAELPFLRAVQSTQTTPDIRAILRAEDLALRERRSGRLDTLSQRNVAGQFYRNMLLDPVAEAARLRALGIKTPKIATP